MAVSSTASLMAIGGDRQVLLYNLDTFALLGVFPFEDGEIYTMTFSLNGEMLFVGGGREGDSAAAVLFDVRSGKRVGEYGRGYDTILSGDISPDHAMLAIGGPDRKVRVYDTADGELLYELTPHTDWIYAIRFSPDGELLSTADRQGGLFFWEAGNGRAVEPLKGHKKAINDMAYTYDSNLMATAGDEGEIIIWDTWKYKQIRRIKAHTGRVLSVNYRKDGQLVSSGEDGLTKRWDAAGKAVMSYEKLADWAYQARFGKDGTLVLGTDWRGMIAVWNTENGERVASLSTRPDVAERTQVAKATD
jgi:WD40 repeat protein